MLISLYKNIHDSQDKDIEIDNFLEGVRSGRWQDIALEVRNAPNKEIKELSIISEIPLTSLPVELYNQLETMRKYRNKEHW